jgi:hypothetical protein
MRNISEEHANQLFMYTKEIILFLDSTVHKRKMRLKECRLSNVKLPNTMRFGKVASILWQSRVYYKIGNLDVSASALKNILKSEYRLSSVDIEIYMEMIKVNCNTSVHYLFPGWLNQTQYLNRQGDQPYSFVFNIDKRSWFDFDFIILPTNVNNNHWVLVVVDIKSKCIVLGDSLGKDHKSFLQQTMRYLTFASMYYHSVPLDINQWSLSYYHKQKDFVMQQNASDCGIYVCLMAKAIVTKCQFSYAKSLARSTVVQEMLRNCFMEDQ